MHLIGQGVKQKVGQDYWCDLAQLSICSQFLSTLEVLRKGGYALFFLKKKSTVPLI